MLLKLFYFLLFINFISSCVKSKEKIEDSLEVAKSYCRCVEDELKNLPDTLIDIYDCEKKVYSKSRLMNIYMSYNNYNKYSESTLDSARKFALEVGNITDTLCINKIDPKRIIKLPHVKM